MPSQITHAICAEDSLPRSHRSILDDPVLHGWLAFGAQGPDIFYHNQRRTPRSIQYGTLLHRHGYGYVTAAMVSSARKRGEGTDGPTAAYIAGFVGHAILDRVLHPYINYRAGRPVSGRPETEALRSMHPFLERLIDVALLLQLRGIHPREFDFYGKIAPLEDTSREAWVTFMGEALLDGVSRAASDDRLVERLHNAWADAFGYYRFTERVDEVYMEEVLAREGDGKVPLHWLTIVHPPNVPDDLDVLNLDHHIWTHPCSSKRTSRESVVDMYRRAAEETRNVITRIFDHWNDADPDQPDETVVSLVGDFNLSDGRPRRRPCRPRHMDPLPLPRLRDAIIASVRAGRGGVVHTLSDLL